MDIHCEEEHQQPRGKGYHILVMRWPK
jgi:hypothetical protein